ncbi:MAG TPA: sigma-70 family RNA polymerase sigma factor [Gemmatimonadales bacterium]|nr:sigma-70 family RNA polymerase sigma factor [Gemmatimonadales bacterium]
MSAEAQRTFRTEALPWIENVRRFAHSLCHDATDTDDLVQETYLRAYQSWHTFQVGTDCRRWLFTICRNVFRRQLRDARDTVSLRALTACAAAQVSTGVLRLDALDCSQTQDDLITRLELAAALDSALPLVPEPYRSALVVVLVQDQTYEAAAAQLNIPVGTLRSRLCRARRLVQDNLLAVALDAGVLSGTRRRASDKAEWRAACRTRRPAPNDVMLEQISRAPTRATKSPGPGRASSIACMPSSRIVVRSPNSSQKVKSACTAPRTPTAGCNER